MFGKNEVTSPFRNEDGSLLVNEIFYTIQGEGPDAGRPAVFVRLAKCNLRCFFCDTEFETGTLRSTSDISIAARIANKRADLAVLTGGEPFLQNVAPLVKALNQVGYEVSIETAGTICPEAHSYLWLARRNQILKIVCSPKTAKLNADLIPHIGAWKYIVAVGQVSEEDGLPIFSTQIAGQEQRLFRPPQYHRGEIFIQPMDEQNPEKNAANVRLAKDICMKFGYRLSLQVHKIVGLP